MAHSSVSSLRIGIVDDSPVFTTALGGFLKKNHYVVQTYNDPATTLTLLESKVIEPPDIFVTDYEMPEMSGLDFIRGLKRVAHLSDIPTLILTGRNISEFLLAAIEAGADAFASKDSINEVVMAQILALSRVANLRKSHNEISARLRADRFEVLFENLSEGVLVLDRRGEIQQVNQVACALLGVSADVLKAQSFVRKNWRFVREDLSDCPVDEMPSTFTLQTGRTCANVRLGIYRGNSELRWLNLNTAPIFLSNKEQPDQVILSMKDITDELAVAEAQRSMVASSKMALLGELASGVAHEISSPIAILSHLAKLSIKKVNAGEMDQPKMIACLEKIEQNVTRIEKIVRGLRAYSRDSELDPMEKTKVKSIIDDVAEICRDRFAFDGISFLAFCENEAEVECRPSQISQVLVNLLINSLDAVKGLTEKWVRLEVSLVGDLLRVSVTDSGFGIPSEALKKLMEPFFTTKPPGQGTGLGLSISKRIIASHNGRIYYDPTSPRTRFVVELPKTQAS